MKKIIPALFALLILTIGTVQAQKLRITKFDFATSVENREPMGVDTVFASNIGNVFCYTQVEGAADTTQIAHVWYFKDQEKARINLDVQSNDWRTWSSKKILDNWTGRWRVMVEDYDGNVLATKTFLIRE